MSKDYRDWIREARESPEYWAEVAADDFIRGVVEHMQALSVSRAELARRLDTSPAYVTKMLGGNANFTLLTMARVAMALDRVVHLQLRDERVIPSRFGVVIPSSFGSADFEVLGGDHPSPVLSSDAVTDSVEVNYG